MQLYKEDFENYAEYLRKSMRERILANKIDEATEKWATKEAKKYPSRMKAKK